MLPPRKSFDKNYWDHCVRKIKLGSEAEAMERYLTIVERTSEPARLQIYLCEYCGYMHVGHVARPGSKREGRHRTKPEFVLAGGAATIMARGR